MSEHDDDAAPIIAPISTHALALEVNTIRLPSDVVARVLLAKPDGSGWLHVDIDVEHAVEIVDVLGFALDVAARRQN